jgi:signal peptidase I
MTDTVTFCRVCAGSLTEADTACPQCGAPRNPTPPGGWPRAVFSGLLSLLMPGLGHVHARAWRLGVAVFGVNVLAGLVLRGLLRLPPAPSLVMLAFAIAAAALVFWAWAAVDAVRRTRRPQTTTRPPWFRSTWVAAVVMVSISLAVGFGIPSRWKSFSIPAGSMIPTLMVGDHIVAFKSLTPTLPDYGDVIVFELPRDPSIFYIKRVVGLPGDRIQMIHGQLTINGQQAVREPAGDYPVANGNPAILKRYLESLPGGPPHQILKASDDGPLNDTGEYAVPEGTVFVLGDNRENSLDSRARQAVGFVPISRILGPAGTIFWSRDLGRIGRRAQ